MKPRTLLMWMIDLIWPAHCLGCGIPHIMLCTSCERSLTSRPRQDCMFCHRPTRDGVPCGRCASHAHVQRLTAAGNIAQPLLEKAIWHLKYHHTPELAGPLADYLLRSLPPHTCTDNPLIVPVPIHATRRARRGYNQAELIAQRIASLTAMIYAPDVLIRNRVTHSQVETHSRHERILNMEGAFSCPTPSAVHDRSVLLIDDVCTSGATLNACAHALLVAGASSVSAAVVARGSGY